MELRSAQITNYKSIDDSTEFRIGQLTCLAGKNESGKTAILQSLRKLNAVEQSDTDFNKTMEFPRQRLTEFSESTEVVVTTVWRLTEEDESAVERVVGPGVLTSRDVTVQRGYDNVRRWSVSCNEQQAVGNLITRANELGDEAKGRLQALGTVLALKQAIEARGADATAGETQLLGLIEAWLDGDLHAAIRRVLASRMPKFLYFSTYSLLPGRVSLEQYKQHRAADTTTIQEQVFEALLALAGTSVEELEGTQLSEELIAKLEGVSNSLSRDIFRYWTQNRQLKVSFSYHEGLPGDDVPFNSGHVFETRIANQRHGVTVRFDERSAGFVWFFSFLVWFSQMRKTYGDRLVILLDEPGLTLHGTAQADLLRYIREQLLPNHQVIYTTHSPFMIDTLDLTSVRTVEDVVDDGENPLGTKVGDQTLSTDAETLFPLRAALGYGLTQSLFVGEHPLLVEGPSDLLYMKWASGELTAKGRQGLDRRWTITPVGGLDKIPSFVALFGAANLDIAVVADYHAGERGKIQRLQELSILDGTRVVTLDSVVGASEADIEDLIGGQFYAHLVNQCYGLSGKNALRMKALEESDLIVRAAADHFRALPPEIPEFDHFRPSAYLIEHAAELRTAPGVNIALDNFESLFSRLNAMLG